MFSAFDEAQQLTGTQTIAAVRNLDDINCNETSSGCIEDLMSSRTVRGSN